MLQKFLPTPADYTEAQAVRLRSNLNVHLIDGSMYVLGMSLVAVQTIIPVFMKELGGGPLAFGSVQVLWTLGANLPGAFVAQFLQRRKFFKPPMMRYGFIHRFMLFVCGLTALLVVGKIPSSVAVPLFLLLIFLIAAFSSVAGLPWFQVYTKTVPVKLRGRLMGMRQLLGSTAAVFGGYLVSFVLAAFLFPLNFSILFFLAFIITMISLYYLSNVVERPTEIIGERKSFNILTEGKRIIRSNRNYRHYLVADFFLIMTFGSVSFYSVFGIEKFSLPASYAGSFTAIMMVSNIVSNIAFGFLADAYGHKINMVSLAGCMALAAVFAIISPNIVMYGFVFIFIGSALQIMAISRLPLIAEMCNEHDRPVYVGVTNSVTAPALIVGIFFGWIVREVGYVTIFALTVFIALIALSILLKYIVEPRIVKI
jgi:MFS family permease